MKLKNIKTMAKAKGIKTDALKKPELIRAIQSAEGNFDCFGTAASGNCAQMNCLWREDCLGFGIE